MTQPLNYTPKAISDLLSQPCPKAPATALGMRYLADKLREAQVFVLSDHGQLLDRSRPRPEVPLAILKPPFPVVALEYTAQTADWDEGDYTAAKASRRISLAWEYSADAPAALQMLVPADLQPGVVVASIAWYDEHQAWMPICGAAHIAYDDEWQGVAPMTPFKAVAIASGRLTARIANAASFPMSLIPLLPDVCLAIVRERGHAGLRDVISADLMDEVNAYADLTIALSCRNVSTREHAPPEALNRQRLKAGKLPLKGFHVLELAGGEMTRTGGGSGDRSAPRSHLRRGHVRRLGMDRMTWVNATIVRGRGFVDKVYAA